MYYVDELITFLDISPFNAESRQAVKALQPKNPTKSKLGRMKPETKRLLDQFYEPFNHQLADILLDNSYEFARLREGVN